MKLTGALLILLLMLAQSFSKVFMIAGFVLNQTVIEATLCENRKTPELKCKGKCQLSKKLNKDEKSNGTIKASNFEVFFVHKLLSISFDQNLQKEPPVTAYTGLLQKPYYSSVFHPPGSRLLII